MLYINTNGGSIMFVYIFISFLYSVIISFISNSFVLIKQSPQTLFIIIPIFLLTNIFAGFLVAKTSNKKIKICQHGTILLSSFLYL